MKEALVIMGSPWSGKDTLAQQFVDNDGFTHIDAGTIVRKYAKVNEMVRFLTMSGLQLPPALTNSIMLEELEDLDLDNLLITGYPRQVENAESLDVFLAEKGVTIESVINLAVSPETIATRHDEARGREERMDHGRDVLTTRLKAYFSQDTRDVLAYYETLGKLKTIDAEQSQDVVYQDARRAYGNTK